MSYNTYDPYTTHIYNIIDNLYIGPISVIHSKEITDFDVVVNCTKEKYDHSNIQHYYEIPVDDTERQENIDNFIIYALKILPDVIEHIKQGQMVFVHCSQGVQRSAAFMALLLIYTKGMTLQESINFIVSKKPNCFSHGRQVNFMKSIVKVVELRNTLQ
jgi:protein-tyrosine phosphatase